MASAHEEHMGTAVRDIMLALGEYGLSYQQRYEAPIADDGVLGPAFLDVLRGALTLLNGELGRHDAGTLDRALRSIGRSAGFPDSQM